MGELPEAMVERVARAIAGVAGLKLPPPPSPVPDGYVAEARAALEAAGVAELLEAARFVLSTPPVEYDAGEWLEEGLKALGAALLRAEGRVDE